MREEPLRQLGVLLRAQLTAVDIGQVRGLHVPGQLVAGLELGVAHAADLLVAHDLDLLRVGVFGVGYALEGGVLFGYFGLVDDLQRLEMIYHT